MCGSPDNASSEAQKNPAPLGPAPAPCPHPDGQVLELERTDHDLEPVQGAPFRVQLWDNSIVTGKLDAKGKAVVPVSAAPVRVQYGPDAKPPATSRARMSDTQKLYGTLVLSLGDYAWYKPDNPDYRPDMSPAELDAFVSKRLKRS
ncbi:MAG TPA: hypothetical protein VJV79_24575 [Polyangiaceae bacterium]|nr:hypothetical protein [Polyangiaceae bacterium]